MTNRPYRIPVLWGTLRKGARSGPVARLVTDRLAALPDVETHLIELEALDLAVDDEGTAIKDPTFSRLIEQSDGLAIVSPEYNHGYPASLKHALDTNYPEYLHKPVGLVGVSTGVLGGARMIENLLPVLRAVGLVPIQRDATVGNVSDAFDNEGNLQDPGTSRRIDGMLSELRWMAAALRYGREHIPAGNDRTKPLACPNCATSMNRHAELIDHEAGDIAKPVFACPLCGSGLAQPD